MISVRAIFPSCLAIALPGRPGYAISCSVPLARLSPAHEEEIIRALASAAADLR